MADHAFLSECLRSERRVIANACKHIQQRPANLISLIRDSQREAGFVHRLHPDSPEIRTALGRMAWATKAACDLAVSGTGPVGVDLHDGTPRVEIERQKLRLGVSDFIRGLYAAMALRDLAVIQTLVSVDVETLRVPGLLFEDYSFHWARALQGFCRGDDSTVLSLRQALEGTDPERLKHGGAEYALFIASLDMELMSSSAAGEVEFNGVLFKALAEGHRRYYGELEVNPGEDQSSAPEGFIALGPLAFACAMRDRGWPITVKSDYLPISIVEGR